MGFSLKSYRVKSLWSYIAYSQSIKKNDGFIKVLIYKRIYFFVYELYTF